MGEKWDDTIVIVKDEYGPDNYLKMAEKYITDYYNRYYPFCQGKTIALENRILRNYFPNICKINMYNKIILYLEYKAPVAARAF